MPDFRTFLNNKKYRNFLVLAVIALAIPLTVILALKQQEIRGRAAAAPDQLEAEGGVLGGNATIVTDTTASGGKSVRFSASVPTQSPTPTPTPTTTSRKVVNVSSIAALKTALADNTVDEIVVANGTYLVKGATTQVADSLWIGSAYAGRTRPILVRAQTTGGVTFSGGGMTYYAALAFTEGAHDQTWQGFTFANGTPTQTGVILFGVAFSPDTPGKLAPHHITLRDITIAGSITSTYPGSGDHSIYFSQSVGGAHDILVDGFTVDGSGGVNTAATFYHSTPTEQNAWNVTLRRFVVTGTYEAFEIWDSTINNLVIEDSTVTNARATAVRYERGQNITLRNIVSTGSPGGRGFYSSLGTNPPQVTFINTNLN